MILTMKKIAEDVVYVHRPWPYMVSGRRVAATRKILAPHEERGFSFSGRGSMACGAKVEIGHVNKFSLHTTKNVLMKNIYQQLQGESCALRPEMVGLASIWMFHLIAQLTKHFCQIPIGQDRT